jgi:plastocyanin
MDPMAILAVRRTEPEPSRPGAHLWPLIFLTLVIMAIAVALLGPGPTTVNSEPATTDAGQRDARVYTISYRFGVFSPTNLRIHAGDTVRWKNDSPLPIHVIAQLQPGQKLPSFDSVGDVQPGSYFSYTFSETGVFGYYNPSDANESGVIIVR